MRRKLEIRARTTRAATATATALTLAALTACARGAKSPPPAQPRDPNVATASDLGAQQPQARRVEELFQGRFPGVQAFATQGGMVVRVRGTSTLTGNSQPLFVVDGQPVQVGSDGLVGINPNDVARIELVKDAADLAQWGSRGGNGVVKITTKRPGRR